DRDARPRADAPRAVDAARPGEERVRRNALAVVGLDVAPLADFAGHVAARPAARQPIVEPARVHVETGAEAPVVRQLPVGVDVAAVTAHVAVEVPQRVLIEVDAEAP